MTINERIRFLRNSRKLSQKKFGEMLGLTQSGVSFIEQNNTVVADKTIIAICSTLNVSRKWLEQGIEPMQNEDSFDMNAYLREKQASDVEIAILRSYFNIDKNIRETLIGHFVKMLGIQHSTTNENNSESNSDNNSEN